MRAKDTKCENTVRFGDLCRDPVGTKENRETSWMEIRDQLFEWLNGGIDWFMGEW